MMKRAIATLALFILVGSIGVVASEGDDRNYLSHPIKRGIVDLALNVPQLDGLPPIGLPDSGKEGDMMILGAAPAQLSVNGPMADVIKQGRRLSGGSAIVGPAGGSFMTPKMRAERQIRKLSRALN